MTKPNMDGPFVLGGTQPTTGWTDSGWMTGPMNKLNLVHRFRVETVDQSYKLSSS